MVKRSKRLEKGIESLNKQIEIHEEKRRLAKENGNLDLEGYYDKEIKSLKDVKARKEKQLQKN